MTRLKVVRKALHDDAAHTLITGATGFIGAALARALHDAGEKTVLLVRDDTGNWPPANGVVRGDVRDYATCVRVLADYRVNRIYHLAAQSIVATCSDDPVGALDVNVMGTAKLLQAARSVGLHPRVVVMTSDKVYGSAPSPYTEDTALDARNAYEVSKAAQDLVARMFFHNYEMDVSVVRAVNVYGPGDPNDTRLIPRTVQRCLRGVAPVIHAGASEMVRAYTYIDDMVSALRVIAAKGVAGDAYCVGSPEILSVREVAKTICDLLSVPFDAIEGERRDGFKEIAEQSIDDRKLRRLGWESTTTFVQGIHLTIDAYRRGDT